MFKCDRLNLTSLNHPCTSARKRGVFACDGCSGAIEIKEGVGMAICSVKGCSKFAEVSGFCITHGKTEAPEAYKRRVELKRAAAAKRAPVQDQNTDAVIEINPTDSRPAPYVSSGEHYDCDFIDEIDRLWQVKRQEWIDDLQGVAYRQRIQRQLSMFTAVESLGY